MLISGILVHLTPVLIMHHAVQPSPPPHFLSQSPPNPWLIYSYFLLNCTCRHVREQERFLLSIYVQVLLRPRWCIDMSTSSTGSCCPDKSRCRSGGTIVVYSHVQVQYKPL
jgi:hypothetical protein